MNKPISPSAGVPCYNHLTGLPGQMLLNDRLEHALERTDRNRGRLAQLWMKFRTNSPSQEIGRETGLESFLPELVRRLRSCTRRGDTLAQLGNSEFIIILEQITSAIEPSLLAREIIGQFTQPLSSGTEEISLRVSIGISLFPEDGRTASQLQQAACGAMQSAARSARSLYRYFGREMHLQALRREQLTQSLSVALARRQMVLHYQPVGDPLRGEAVGVEALLRWQHPQKGLIPPADFIPFLEETGLICPIGEWVLREACKQIAIWRVQGQPGLCLSVNISPRQLEITDFAGQVRGILAEARLEAAALSLEIDAGTPLDAGHSEALEQLISLGVTISLDDFGAGTTALAGLKQYPLRSLKIDRRFTGGIPHCQEDVAVTSAIIALARSLGIKAIAKGVETREQLAFLHSNRCKEVQGFIFARPMSAQECGNWLKQGRRDNFLQACQ